MTNLESLLRVPRGPGSSQTDWSFENLDDTTAGDAAVTGQGEGNESDDDTDNMEDMVDEGIERNYSGAPDYPTSCYTTPAGRVASSAASKMHACEMHACERYMRYIPTIDHAY